MPLVAGHRAAERDAPLHRGEGHFALVHEVGELVRDGLLQLQPGVRRAERRAEQGRLRRGHILEQLRPRGLRGARQRDLHDSGIRALGGLRGDVPESLERDLDVGLLGLAKRTIRREERVFHDAKHVPPDDGVLREDVLDLVGVHERRRDVLDHLLDCVVQRLVPEGARDLVVHDTGGWHAADDRRERVVHPVAQLANEGGFAPLAEEHVPALEQHFDDLLSEILGKGRRHGAQLTRSAEVSRAVRGRFGSFDRPLPGGGRHENALQRRRGPRGPLPRPPKFSSEKEGYWL